MTKSAITFLALALAVLIRIVFVFQLPASEAVDRRLEGLNDEASHYNYVWYIATNRSFPVQTMSVQDSGAFEKDEFEYYQPPLYYLIASFGAGAVGHSGGLMISRILSFVFGVLTCAVIYKIAQIAKFSDEDAVLSAAFVALLPTHAYFSSVASNDALSWLIAAAVILVAFRHRNAHSEKMKWLMAIATGVLLGLGLLTKSSLLVLAPFVALVFLITTIQKERKATTVLQGMVALALASILAGPWYVRNLNVYGSFLPFEVGFGTPQFWIDSVGDSARFIWGSANSFWFPMQHLQSSTILKGIRLVDLLLIGVHVGVGIVALFRKKRNAELYLLVFLLVLAVSAFVRLNLFWWNSEGRYLFAALPAIAILFVFSARRIVRETPDDLPFTAYVLLVAFHPYLYLAFA